MNLKKLLDENYCSIDSNGVLTFNEKFNENASIEDIREGISTETEIYDEFCENIRPKIKKIVLPSTLKEIKSDVFNNYSELEEVVLNDGIEIINMNAFKNCKKLKNINFPETLKKEMDAFVGCELLDKSKIPVRLKTDENGVMNKVYLEDIEDGILRIPNGVKEFNYDPQQYKNIKILYEKNYCPTIHDASEIKFSDGLEKIGAMPVWEEIKKIEMPDSVLEFDNFVNIRGEHYIRGVFCNLEDIRFSRNLKKLQHTTLETLLYCNDQLQYLILPDSVTTDYSKCKEIRRTRGDLEFSYMPTENLIYKQMTPEKGYVKNYERISSGEVTKNYTINGSEVETTTEKIELPKKTYKMSDTKNLDKKELIVIDGTNIDAIGNFTFSQCPKLKEVIIKEGVKEIGIGAFAGCEKLEKITLPKSLTKISDLSFYNCKSLKSITIPGKTIDIGNRAFYNCENLTSAFILSKVNEIGKLAFCSCSKLQAIGGLNEVKIIDDAAFLNCERLKIKIPKKIEEIGQYAYTNCGKKNWLVPNFNKNSKLEETEADIKLNENILILPSTLKRIKPGAFYGCEGILGVHANYDSKLKTIEESTFTGCTRLQFADIPEQVEEVQDKAFSGCKSLEQINIPESVKKLGEESFSNCDNLKIVFEKGDILRTSSTFYNSPNVTEVKLGDLDVRYEHVGEDFYEVESLPKKESKFSLSNIKKSIQKHKEKDKKMER